MDYQVTFVGEVTEDTASTEVRVIVPVTSLCPCSKKISDYGAHNQRSHVTVSIVAKAFIWIEEIIDIVEQESQLRTVWPLKASR